MLMCLALNGYHEARGELTAGEIAVNHACHFSWWCDGKSDKTYDLDAWLRSNQLASNIILGYTPDITDGATHYHKIGYYPNWIKDRGMVRLGLIGEHIFYRWE